MYPKVLLVDNIVEWHDIVKSRLEPLGFRLYAVTTSQEALRALSKMIFHLALVDKRLESDRNQDDIGGWNLIDSLKKLDPSLPCVMLTGYPDEIERTKRQDVFYMAKDTIITRDYEKGGYVGTNAIAEQYKREWAHNLKLSIVPVIELSALLDAVEFREQLYKDLSSQEKAMAKEEFELLLKRLFKRPIGKVTLSPFHSGKSGAGVLLAQPDKRLKGVLKFGAREKVIKEFENYQEYVEPFVANRTVTAKEWKSETRSMGAILYTLVGHSTQNPVTFGQFFKSATPKAIIRVLENLFCDILSPWYDQASPRSIENLSRLYREDLRLNDGRIQYIRDAVAEAVVEEVSLLSLHNSTVDFVFEYAKSVVITLETQKCIVHGDLHGKNILVENDSAWLIDFARTELSHIFRDLADLEVFIKTKLLSIDELLCILELEKSLIMQDIFSTSLDTTHKFTNSSNSEELDKVYRVICSLRQIANKISNQKAQLVEYYVALFYTTLFRLQFFPTNTPEGKRRIVQAILSCEQLATLLKDNGVGTGTI